MTQLSFSIDQLWLALRVAAGLGLAFWLFAVLDGKRWWPAGWSLHLDAAARPMRPGTAGQVCVVVPARNEAPMIPRTLPRLLKQSDWYDRLLVIDDRSADRTASAATRVGSGGAGDEKLRVVSIDEVPDGWTGRTHALQTGYLRATEGWAGDPKRQWLLFTDADIQHPTSSLSRILAKADTGGYDLVSVMVRLRASSLWDWLLVPAFVYFFQFWHPFRRVSDARTRHAAACSDFLLVRRSYLDEIGGFEPVKEEVADAKALARVVKRAGGKVWLGLDPDISSLRVHGDLGSLTAKLTRRAFDDFGGSFVRLPVVWVGLLLFVVAPALLTVVGAVRLDPWLAAPAALAWLLQTANYLPVVQYQGVPSGLALTLPIAGLMYVPLTAQAALHRATGRMAPWRQTSESDASLR